MDLAGLESRFRSRVRDQVEPYLASFEDVANWASEAEREACIRAHLLRDSSTPEVCEITLTALAGGTYSLHERVDTVETAYITDAYGVDYLITIMDEVSFKKRHPAWFSLEPGLPEILVQNEKTITVYPAPAATYTLSLDVFRMPLSDMTISVDEPEIAVTHHDNLIYWMEKRYYEMPEVDANDAGKAAVAEQAFIRCFGIRPDANVRRKHRERRAHVVKPIQF